MGLKIENAGLLTSIQDLGRSGYQKEGIIVSGAMDVLALRIANILVGNRENAATLEFTFPGPKIEFTQDCVIALTGSDFSPTINQEPIKTGRPIFVSEGCTLSFGAARAGNWGYLSVAGGLDIPEVLGSKSTYLRAGFGGYQGRVLKKGDEIPVQKTVLKESFFRNKLTQNKDINWVQTNWRPNLQLLPNILLNPTISVIAGPEYDRFEEAGRKSFWENEFIVTSDSDRMGYRLQGPQVLLKNNSEILSTGVTFGTIQVPASGNPVVLLADHQTTGGYPRIGQICSVDFSKMVQVPFGRKVRFKEISVEEAQYLYSMREKNLAHLKQAIHFKLN